MHKLYNISLPLPVQLQDCFIFQFLIYKKFLSQFFLLCLPYQRININSLLSRFRQHITEPRCRGFEG